MTRRTVWNAALAAVALTWIAGPTHAQGPGGAGGRGGPGGPGGFGGPGSLLAMPEVQKELKLQQAQVDLLQAMNEERRNKGREAFQQFQNLTPEQRQQRFAAMQQDEEKQVAQILDPPQMARLKQLQLQQAGMRALDRKDVADTLKLSPAQRQAVQAALQSERDTMQKTFEALRNGQTDGQPPTDEQRQAFQQAFQQMRTLRTSTDAKLAAVLTDAQKKQLQQMQGAPFQFPQPRFGGFGGPGGPGGPRPGGK